MTKRWTGLLAAACIIAGGFSGAATAQVTLDNPMGEIVPYTLDSGMRPNIEARSTVAFTDLVHSPGSMWLRLYFDQSSTNLDKGSFLRITSVHDGEVQELDAQTLEMWQYTTAYFNGDTVIVELVAAPDSANNRVVVESTGIMEDMAMPIGGLCGICEPDDRVPSDENAFCRVVPAGCSGTVFNEQSCIVTAGHCAAGGGVQVLHFNVPNSLPNCQPVAPPIADQFPTIDVDFDNNGVGDDWAVATVGSNNLGQTPFERYGRMVPIANGPPSIGQLGSVTGYGTDNQCTLTSTQQTDDGNIVLVESNNVRFSIEATFGNSGSSLVRSGEIVGIVSHCSTSCSPQQNIATRIDNADVANAIDTMCPEITGACCFGASCGIVTQQTCIDIGGEFQGDDSDCEQCVPEGACCLASGQCGIVSEETCGDLAGTWAGAGTTCDDVTCEAENPCPADFDGNESVDTSDLLALLGVWGQCDECDEDLNDDGEVNTEDLLELLGTWGPCQ